MRKLLFQSVITASVASISIFSIQFALAQNWTEPASAPPAGNTPGVIWNSQVSGSQQNASYNLSGTGRLGGSGAFGNFTPDATWMITSPNAYFGNGVAGTIIGAGGGQNAGDIKTDGNLYVAGNEGIGTIAPTAKLQVVSNDEILRLSGWSGAPNSYYLGLTSVVGASTVDYRLRTVDDVGGTKDVLFFDSSSGNVGIGTTGPGASTRLQVAGMGLFTGGTYNPGDGAPAGTEIGFNTVSNYGFLQAVTTGFTWWPLAINPGGGNVGIGTMAPTSLLGLQGRALSLFTNNPILATMYTTDGYAANMGGGIQFGGEYNSSQNLTTFGYIGGLKENAADGNYAGKLVFGTRTHGTGAEEMTRMTITSTGNVGIGTVNPGSRLDVSGNINSSGDIIGARLCLGADCRSAWPAGGGGGDITAVNAGTGITGGGTSGDVIVTLDTTYTDNRYVNASGDTMTGDLTLSGASSDLTVGGGGAFGGYTPDTNWKVTAPNGYFGDGGANQVLIGLGGGFGNLGGISASGRISTSNDLYVGGGDIDIYPAIAGQNSNLRFNGDGALFWVPGGNNFEFNRQVFFRGGLYTTAGQTAGFNGPVTVSAGYNLNVQGGQITGVSVCTRGGAICSGAPYSNADTVSASNLCLGADCRNAWPAGGGGGDITSVNAGAGLSGGGVVGDVTLSWAGNTLAVNSGLKGNGSPGAPLQVGAGAGILVSGDTVSFAGNTLALNSGLKGAGSLANPIYVGAGTGIKVITDFVSLDASYTDNRYVNASGDTMSGTLRVSGAICAQGGTSCPAFLNVGQVYGDLAYSQFDVAEYILSAQKLQPGEVVVADPKADEQVLRSSKAYDTTIVGVISTDPGVLGGYTLEAKAGTQKVQLSLAGRVPVKVSAENGAIKRGDLLTTSNTPGYAMKCTDRAACAGAIVGKALGELEFGKGSIIVLMSLQ